MLRKFPEDWMMEVHGSNVLFHFFERVKRAQKPPAIRRRPIGVRRRLPGLSSGRTAVLSACGQSAVARDFKSIRGHAAFSGLLYVSLDRLAVKPLFSRN